jgi:hypothetical protein
MSAFYRQIAGWFQKLRFLPDYFKTLAQQWMNILFGETVLAVVFLVWWALGTPPLTLIFVSAAVVAGYFVWYGDHIRLVPKLEITRSYHLQETPVEQGDERRVFIQIEPKCLSESPVNQCLGHLLRVYKRHSDQEDWALTEMRERLLLEWSHYGSVPVTLYPSGGQYLNICFRVRHVSIIIPTVNPRPSRWREVFDSSGTFRFDIEITAQDCTPAQASVTVTLDQCEWNKPTVTVAPSSSG